MEKRSPLFYVGLFLMIILGILAFSAGTLMTVLFSEVNSPTPLTEFGVSSLGAIVFIVSYFLGTFAQPLPADYLQGRIRSSSCILAAIFFVWWMILSLGFLFSVLSLKNGFPVRPFFMVAFNYSVSGNIFAWISNRINAMKKV